MKRSFQSLTPSGIKSKSGLFHIFVFSKVMIHRVENHLFTVST